jgi:hypothetical protein
MSFAKDIERTNHGRALVYEGETLPSAVIVDPWGTSIELTDGVGAL